MQLEINRARGFRLYLKDGRRIVDLLQQGGLALLGHNPPGLLRALKNSAERGLYAPPPPGFVTAAEGKLLRALRTLFVAECGEYAENFTYRLYNEAFLEEVDDYYVPFFRFPEKEIFYAVLPFPFPAAPIVAVLDNNKDDELEKNTEPSDPISPVILECAARCVHDLIKALPARGNVRFPAVDAYFQKEEDESDVWKRTGIYIFYEGRTAANGFYKKNYADVCHFFFKNGFLLPPPNEEGVPLTSLILPGEMSPGEDAKLAKLFEMSGEEYRETK